MHSSFRAINTSAALRKGHVSHCTRYDETKCSPGERERHSKRAWREAPHHVMHAEAWFGFSQSATLANAHPGAGGDIGLALQDFFAVT
jgi:hypothetical protein